MKTNTGLPKKLIKEPLIDAVFEIRFKCDASAAEVLPGYLFGELEGPKKIERLGGADLPKAMREADPNLQFSPLIKIIWNGFFIVIGDNSIGIACGYPYPGWASFQPVIIKVVEAVYKSAIISNIDRFSMKYVDLIPTDDLKSQIESINLDVQLGGYKLEKNNFSLRMDIPDQESSLLHVVNIVSSAVTTLIDGSQKDGIIIDIDTISFSEAEPFEDWIKKLNDNLETLHTKNKEMFFNCLNESALQKLEPEYE